MTVARHFKVASSGLVFRCFVASFQEQNILNIYEIFRYNSNVVSKKNLCFVNMVNFYNNHWIPVPVLMRKTEGVKMI